MKLWFAVRRPIGFVLFGVALYLTLVALHVIPEFLLAFVTGRI